MSTNESWVLMSGGIDSYACAHFLMCQGKDVHGMFIDYGQAAAKLERDSVEKISGLLGIPISYFTVTGGAPFTSGELVGRNAFFISSALFFAPNTSGLIAIGIHSGTQYYDCSSIFLETMNRLVGEQTDGSIKVIAPFLKWTKKDVFEYFKVSGLSLDATYSCEAGVKIGCGKCASCADRRAINAI
jgi:7-cyano-7-deazaguanine synthase